MKVSAQNSNKNSYVNKNSGYRKLEAIKTQRENQKKIKQAEAEKAKPLVVEDKVELTPKVTVRDKEKTVISDVGANNPSDPAVQEKLRTILRSGGFDFSPQERQVLGEILEEPEVEKS